MPMKCKCKFIAHLIPLELLILTVSNYHTHTQLQQANALLWEFELVHKLQGARRIPCITGERDDVTSWCRTQPGEQNYQCHNKAHAAALLVYIFHNTIVNMYLKNVCLFQQEHSNPQWRVNNSGYMKYHTMLLPVSSKCLCLYQNAVHAKSFYTRVKQDKHDVVLPTR